MDARARLKDWLASGQARLQPLTFPQRELWETSPVAPGDAANNICSFFEIKGSVTFDQCEAAVRSVVARQEAMRTSFLPGKSRPVQIIRSSGEPILRFRELTAAESRPEALEEILSESFDEPFDLLQGPLYRAEMIRRGTNDYVLAFTIHHAVADGWTLGAFVEDLCTAYILDLKGRGKPTGPAVDIVKHPLSPVPMTYSDWGAAERARWTPEELARHVDYWKPRLAGSGQLWGRTKNEGGATEPLRRWMTSVPADLAEATRALARRSGSTVFNALLAAFQLTLSRWTGVNDITVGTPVANRGSAAVKETMGYFSGVVPLRGEIDPAQPFADRLRTVHNQTMDAFAHAMPFAELASALDGKASSPDALHTLFDTRFAFQNHPLPDEVLPGISTKLRTCSTGTARFDLGCEITEERSEFEVVWLHRPMFIPATEIRELDQLFHNVLASVCRRPEIQPGALAV